MAIFVDRPKQNLGMHKSVGEHPKFQKNMTSGLRRCDNQIVTVLSQGKFDNSKIATIQLCQVMDQNHLGVERNLYAKFQRIIFIDYMITGKITRWQMAAIFVNGQTPNGCAQLDQQEYIPDKVRKNKTSGLGGDTTTRNCLPMTGLTPDSLPVR